jgi:hypothetical protein
MKIKGKVRIQLILSLSEVKPKTTTNGKIGQIKSSEIGYQDRKS